MLHIEMLIVQMLNIVSATRMTAFHYNLACPLAGRPTLEIALPLTTHLGFRFVLSPRLSQLCLKVPILLGLSP